MKPKIILLLILLFLGFNGAIYYMTSANLNNTTRIVLENKLNILSTHYKVLLETQKKVADSSYAITISNDKIIEILKLAYASTPQKQNELREEFHKLVTPMYKIFKEEGVLQYHFIFPNNKVFYRAHKISKFGDDLTKDRADFAYVNKTKEIFRGFAQGKTAHAFRNVYPIFDKNHNHIGAIEISFSSDSFQWYLNHISNIHSHFIVDKKIFEANTWKRDDLILKYVQSSENKDYMLTLTDIHNKKRCIEENGKKLAPYSEEINSKISKGNPFSLCVTPHNNIDKLEVISFLPIKNPLENKVLAWIVSYEKSPILNSTIRNTFIVQSAMFILSILIFYFIIKQIHAKQKLANLNLNLKEITQEQNLLLSLFDKGESVLFKWNNDSNWSIDYVSNSVSKLLGYEKDEFLNQTITYGDCVHKDDIQRVTEEVKEGSINQKDYFKHQPYRVLTKTNKLKWVTDNTIVVRNKEGVITHYIGYISDISVEKENEELKEKQQKFIADQTKNAQMGEMIGNIAHQWRQPLSLISTAASGILMQKEFGILDDKKENEMLNNIVKTTKHLSLTIDTFRDYIKEKKEMKEVILQDRLHNAIDIIKASLQNNHIKLINEIDTIEPIKITMVIGELSEVIINLINNAKDALIHKKVENPFVKIALEKNDNKAIITITDNGGGIPEDILVKIFDPYFTTKHKSQGTGLGLYMSKEIIEKHLHGTLNAKNSDFGAMFTITLPLEIKS
jgi:PAS domain S-box-containing protein